MGQYGNQPDFGTEAAVVTPSDTVAAAGSNYRVGDIVTIAAGGNNATFRIDATQTLEPTATDAVTFVGVPAGSILPVIVDYVLATGTTATNMIALK